MAYPAAVAVGVAVGVVVAVVVVAARRAEMTEEQIALARRAVACRGWKWLPGMRAIPCSPHDSGLRGIPVRVVHVYDGDGLVVWGEVPGAHSGSWEEWRWREEGRLPDLTDPATLGCLLALVREAWRCPTVYVRQGTTRRVSDGVIAWEVCDLWLDAEACRALGVDRQGGVGSWGHGSEAEALVAALEAAP